ncbi:hypothetical protein ACQ4PT_015494 [Festuca glaucescens]
MPGVPRELAEHHLHVRPEAKTVKQPLRRFAEDRRKAIGATYQRCMQKCLQEQIGRNVHAYVDDVVVKTKEKRTLLDDPRETFTNLRRFRMKLNLAKCTFGVPAGQMLGYLVSQRGIEANPKKISALERMELPQCLKDVQKFTGCLASLSRFADAAFRDLKHMLSTAPILASPASKEPMLIEVLSQSKQNYPHYQKLTYGVYMPARKLKHYFQEHPIKVVCTAPLAKIIGSKDANGRVAKWALELAAHSILYEPRTAIKSQALVDFFVDWAEVQYLLPVPDSSHWKMHFDGSKMRGGLGAGIVLTSPKGDRLDYVLQIHFAASNNVAEYEALIHGLKLAKEIGVRRILCFGDFDLVVQQASGEWDAKDANMAAYRFHVQQIAGFFKGCEFHHVPRANNEAADSLSKIGSTRQAIPPGIALEHLHKPSIIPSPDSDSIFVPADPGALQLDPGAFQSDPGASQPNLGASQLDPEAPQPDLGAPQPDPGASKPEVTVASVSEIRSVPSWAQEFLSYLADGELPEDRVLARQIERRAKAYTIINHQLYKRSVSGIFQQCVEPAEGIELLREIHQGQCGHHASSRAIVGKAFRHGFYRPTALKDAENMVRACNGCQRFSKQRHAPASALKTIPITWPFAVWGLDMVGPFRTTRSGMTHLLVTVDMFTKWIEAKPIKKLGGSTTVTFLNDIILRYGYPHSIITDNGTNFTQGAFSRFCGEKGIQLDLASVAHPQSNGQVEKANGLILADIRPRLIEPLERATGCWIEELPAVLWSLCTTPNRSTGFTPFFLVYGAEAVLPTDIEHDAPKIILYTEAEAKEAREDGVDLLEEARLLAVSRSAIYQQSLCRYHSRKVQPLAFCEGDLVLWLIQRTAGQHKLSSPWEGPFIVSRALGNDSYYHVDAQEARKNKPARADEETKRPWNVNLLRPFYT